MDIITRNYLRLLRAGAFQEQETIEPMSAWKWSQVLDMSMQHHTAALVYDGIRRCNDQFFLHIGDKLTAQWKQVTTATEDSNRTTRQQAIAIIDTLKHAQCRPILVGDLAFSRHYLRPDHRDVRQVEVFFPYETQGKKADSWAEHNGTNIDYTDRFTLKYQWQGQPVVNLHRLLRLSNKLHNHSLRNMVEQELREGTMGVMEFGEWQTETLNPSLTLFQLLLQLSTDLICNGLTIIDLVDIGSFLRATGDRVDYIKLQGWIDRMKMQRMVQIIGQLLTELLAFAPDELPFTTLEKRLDLSSIVQETLTPSAMRSKRMTFTQTGNSIFLHSNNTSAFMWHARRSARFMKYYPSESITNFFASFTRSLTNIEE